MGGVRAAWLDVKTRAINWPFTLWTIYLLIPWEIPNIVWMHVFERRQRSKCLERVIMSSLFFLFCRSATCHHLSAQVCVQKHFCPFVLSESLRQSYKNIKGPQAVRLGELKATRLWLLDLSLSVTLGTCWYLNLLALITIATSQFTLAHFWKTQSYPLLALLPRLIIGGAPRFEKCGEVWSILLVLSHLEVWLRLAGLIRETLKAFQSIKQWYLIEFFHRKDLNMSAVMVFNVHMFLSIILVREGTWLYNLCSFRLTAT